MATKSKTKKPSGLTITRDGNKIVCSWKIADKDYDDGQQFQFKVNNGSWNKSGDHPKRSATSKTVTLTASKYYPATSKTIDKVSFRVRGKRKKYQDKSNKKIEPDWSDWTSKTFNFSAPNKPGATATLTASNVTDFKWSVGTAGNDAKHFVSVEYGTQLRTDAATDGNKITSGWTNTVNSNASGTYTVTETSSVIATGTHTRWFRVRARGFGGVTPWVYAKHVYATPQKASVTGSSVRKSGSVSEVTMSWTAKPSTAYPIDSQEAQWVIATPNSGLTCPANANWQTGRTISGATAKNSASFTAEGQVSTDECMWVRAMTKHDENEAFSLPFIAWKGNLEAPTNVSVSTDTSTSRATITATNASSVPDSKLAIIYRPGSAPTKQIIVGVIPHGGSSVTVQCPNFSSETTIAFGVYAYQGTERAITRADGVSQYEIAANMKSSTIWEGGSVAPAPTNVIVEPSETDGEVVLTWNWSWNAADISEISWSQNINAWESTDEPSTYQINNLHASKWRVSGLATGSIWYFRIRLGRGDGDSITWGPYCDPVACDLTSAPATPVMYLSESVITEEGSVTASWAYTSTDGTRQALAEICEATVSGDTITYGSVIASTLTAQSTTLHAADYGWTTGTTHYLCVRVTSESGHASAGWSDPVAIYIASPVACIISSTSLGTATVIDDYDEHDQPITRTVTALTAMPLTVAVTGSNIANLNLVIERAEAYQVDRPDESQKVGYDGETVYIASQSGLNFTITNEDLIGTLDDGAKYRIIATAEDLLGQTASDSVEFEVHWSHQAVIPTAQIEVNDYYLVAFITPIAPDDVETGDVCDIYRLSADKPELIVEGAAWGTKYVDPYPTIGMYGGYRIVFRSVNGDYITEDMQMAWTDYTAEEGYILDLKQTVIDFSGGRALLEYNLDLSSQWKKDFKETKYLGGSVRGDWGAAVSRTASVGATVLTLEDLEAIRDLRRLATHPGICHVRTPDGSSYSADVQVSETESYRQGGHAAEFSISITRVDPEELDGVAYTEWITTVEE